MLIKEGVIHRGRRPRLITPSYESRYLVIALLFIQNKSPFFRSLFSAHQNNTTLPPDLTSLVQYLVNSSWLWRIMRAVLTNEKRRNILNE